MSIDDFIIAVFCLVDEENGKTIELCKIDRDLFPMEAYRKYPCRTCGDRYLFLWTHSLAFQAYTMGSTSIAPQELRTYLESTFASKK